MSRAQVRLGARSVDTNRRVYRKDVADQLRRVERDVLSHGDRFVTSLADRDHELVLTVSLAHEEAVAASVIVSLGDTDHGGRGWADWLTLSIATDEGRTQLLELAWYNENSHRARTTWTANSTRAGPHWNCGSTGRQRRHNGD